jgi:hypothetical protein
MLEIRGCVSIEGLPPAFPNRDLNESMVIIVGYYLQESELNWN